MLLNIYRLPLNMLALLIRPEIGNPPPFPDPEHTSTMTDIPGLKIKPGFKYSFSSAG